jgi:hypothetical protein
MTYTMFDAVGIEHIPNTASLVAGYVNGYWPTYNDLCGKFPLAHHVSIAVQAGVVADVLDVERGDATPENVPLWVKEMRNLKRKPIVYTSRANVPAVQSECAKALVAEPFFWVADWTNHPHLVPGSIGTQWADGTALYPGLAMYTDTSLISPNWPGLGNPAPTPAQLAAAKMVLLPNVAQSKIALDNNHPLYGWNGHAFVLLPSGEPTGLHEYANIFYEHKRP